MWCSKWQFAATEKKTKTYLLNNLKEMWTALYRKPISQNRCYLRYGTKPATQHKWMCPNKTPAKQADLPTPEKRKAELTLVLVIYWDGLPVGRQSPIQAVTTWSAVKLTRSLSPASWPFHHQSTDADSNYYSQWVKKSYFVDGACVCM